MLTESLCQITSSLVQDTADLDNVTTRLEYMSASNDLRSEVINFPDDILTVKVLNKMYIHKFDFLKYLPDDKTFNTIISLHSIQSTCYCLVVGQEDNPLVPSFFILFHLPWSFICKLLFQ